MLAVSTMRETVQISRQQMPLAQMTRTNRGSLMAKGQKYLSKYEKALHLFLTGFSVIRNAAA